MIRRVLMIAAALALPLSGVQAACSGADLRTTLTSDEREKLSQTLEATVYTTGNHWRAERDGQVIHLIGTMHLDDPRHDGPADRLRPVIETAGLILVETDAAGPEILQDMLAQRPEALILPGTSLPEHLSEADWAKVTAAARTKGLPPFMVSRFQPWYLSTVLSTPTCAQDPKALANGLDQRLMAMARAAQVPVAPLEDVNTVFTQLSEVPLDTQLRMLTATIASTASPVDLLATTTAAYFDEAHAESWIIAQLLAERSGQFPPEIVNQDGALVTTAILTQRNRNWIPVILSHLDRQPLVAAFGAAHLFGDQGVLQLLEDEGFALTRLPF